jgi:aminoglycoside/choline kinase family phosphotransferase
MQTRIIMASPDAAASKSKQLHTALMPQADARLALIDEWLARDLKLSPQRLEPASSDASFRRYFRAFTARGTYVVMDAPPAHEDVRPYLNVSRMLEALGVHVPHVHEVDTARGLLLIEDLGSTLYLARLAAGDDPEPLYGDALDVLALVQAEGAAAAAQLDPYDRAPLEREMALMPEWFCTRHLGLELSQEERGIVADAGEFLVRAALAQPQVFVHRDYHSRNLMRLETRNPGVIDFQDALRGPIGYDLVSLLKDCYIAWPRTRVEDWVRAHHARLRARGAALGADAQQLIEWVDLIGVQRHLKVLGIFARLWYRDGKPGYLRDLPLTLEYVLEACARQPRLAPLGEFLARRALPALPAANARAASQASGAQVAPAATRERA